VSIFFVELIANQKILFLEKNKTQISKNFKIAKLQNIEKQN